MTGNAKDYALWMLAGLATTGAFALAPPLGSGAIYRKGAGEPSCAVESDLTIDVVPVRSVAEARGPRLDLAIDATSRQADQKLLTFGYALYDDVGQLIRTGQSDQSVALVGAVRTAGGLSIPSGLTPGYYRLHVIAVAAGNDGRALNASRDVHLEVTGGQDIIELPTEEWRMLSRYDQPTVTIGSGSPVSVISGEPSTHEATEGAPNARWRAP